MISFIKELLCHSNAQELKVIETLKAGSTAGGK